MLIDPRQWQLGLAGYGEVSRILAQDMRDPGLAVAAFDLKFDAATDAATDSDSDSAHPASLRQHGVELPVSHAALAAGSDLVISAVAASDTVAMVQACSPATADCIFPRFQPGLASRQAASRRVDRGGRRALFRGRGNDQHPGLPHRSTAAGGRALGGRTVATDQRTGLCRPVVNWAWPAPPRSAAT